MKKLFIAASMVLLMTGSAFAQGWGGRGEYRGERNEFRRERREFRESPRYEHRFERDRNHDRFERRYDHNYYYGGGYRDGVCRRGW